MNKKIHGWKSDVGEFEGEALEMWERFLESLSLDKKFTTPTKEIEDSDERSEAEEENWCFIYTRRGMTLAERMRDRLIKLGEKYFPDEEIELETHMYREQ